MVLRYGTRIRDNRVQDCEVDLVQVLSGKTKHIKLPGLQARSESLCKQGKPGLEFTCDFGVTSSLAFAWDPYYLVLFEINLESGATKEVLNRKQLEVMLGHKVVAGKYAETFSLSVSPYSGWLALAVASSKSINDSEPFSTFPETILVNLKTRAAKHLGRGMPIGWLSKDEVLTWELQGSGSEAWVINLSGKVCATTRNRVGLSVSDGKVLSLGQRATRVSERTAPAEKRLQVLDRRLRHVAWGQTIDPPFKWWMGASLIAIRL